jgi:hypothetical protein
VLGKIGTHSLLHLRQNRSCGVIVEVDPPHSSILPVSLSL